MAKRLLKNPNVTDSDVGQAITLLTECLSFPENIGEGKLLNAQDNDFYYFLGKACQMRGYETTARTYFEKGTAGPTEPAAAMYYNDAKADKIFYAAMCYRELGMEQMARSLFNKLISYGEKHLFDNITMDYFAVSLPDLLVWRGDLTESNRIHCNYMLALGHYGIGNTIKAEQYLRDVISMDINHLGALSLKTYIS
jgi:tetratricopeptide (TPR) repeat protein